MKNLSEIRDLVEGYIRKNDFQYEPAGLYEPLDYILQLGGKRLRPITLLLSMQLFNDHISKALPAAFAIELFHNFSLIHDDIMDAAPLRRGKTTVHERWDTNTAILSGDAMLIYGYKYLNQSCVASNCIEVNNLFTKTAIDVCEGQQMDMNFEKEESVSQDDYIKMIYKKTAALVEGAMRIGAVLGGASSQEVDAIGSFAQNLGISFQLQDDILDTFGNAHDVGKQPGGDIIQNKKTILYILAMSSDDQVRKSRLLEIFGSDLLDNQTKVTQVIEIFEQLGIHEKAVALRDHYHQIAFEHLDQLRAGDDKKQPIVEFADSLLKRSF
ncbi:MAG: polyprenyl synthetase family protein [Bacteroidia bacterium]|nr:polyprenyl synthetase family protein [Bacteroidia bacterium]